MLKTNSTTLTFKDQAEKWLQWSITRKRDPIRPETARTYKSQIKNHISPLLGTLSLEDVGNKALKVYIQKLSEKGLGATSISLNVNIIKQIVASAVNDEGDQLYPRTWNSDFMDLPVIGEQKQPMASVQALQDGLSCLSGNTRALVAILAGSGLRIKEALAITGGYDDNVSNYWNGEKIIVRAQLVRDPLTGRQKLAPPKTKAGVREIDLSPELNDFLKKTFTGVTGYMFPMSEETYRLRLVECGIIGGFHSLRRFRVTYLRLNSVPEPMTQFWIGHAGGSITERYTKVGEEILARKVQAERVGLGFKLPEIVFCA